MRFIDLAFVAKPEGFDVRAKAAYDDGPDAVDNHANVWQSCKDALKVASHGKCFYCEAKENRSDGAVDHYRPKSIYTWAAFRFSNFRFACTFCNSLRKDKATGKTGGKGNDFPLSDGCQRATCEEEEPRERPKLIDPCRAGDPIEIDFLSDGRAVPAFQDEGDERKVRAETSIHAYHLNHSAFVEERQNYATVLHEKIQAATTAQKAYAAGDISAKIHLDSAISDLHRAIQPHARYSAFAKRVLNCHKDKRLIEAILATT